MPLHPEAETALRDALERLPETAADTLVFRTTATYLHTSDGEKTRAINLLPSRR